MGDKPANSPTQDGNTTTAPTSGGGDEFKPITSQDDLNRIITERIARERSKFSDYPDLKAKAEKFDELDAANKSEIEKATEKAAAAERERDAAAAEAMRWKVAAKHGVSDEDAELFLTGNDEETLTKQAQRLTDRVADRKKQNNHVPREGTPPRGPQPDEMREFTRKLFQNAD
jgi:hypothetical protein